MKQQISDNERRELQLQMLDEIHEVCEKNGIKYSLSCGTLLGAIRHQGFIPWDDDVDIMMPYPEMMRFKRVLKSNSLQYVDSSIDKSFGWFFSRVISKKTYSQPGLFTHDFGVSIDLYPVVNIPDEVERIESFLIDGEKLKEASFQFINWQRRAMRFLSLKHIPDVRRSTQKIIEHVYHFAETDTSTFFVVSGSFKWINVFRKDLFNDLVSAQFEDRKYTICRDYDDYLRQVYGDYMKLPPVGQRSPYHGGVYYWI